MAFRGFAPRCSPARKYMRGGRRRTALAGSTGGRYFIGDFEAAAAAAAAAKHRYRQMTQKRAKPRCPVYIYNDCCEKVFLRDIKNTRTGAGREEHQEIWRGRTTDGGSLKFSSLAKSVTVLCPPPSFVNFLEGLPLFFITLTLLFFVNFIAKPNWGEIHYLNF